MNIRAVFFSLLATFSTVIVNANPNLSNKEISLLAHVQQAIINAQAHQSRLHPQILELEGMSSPKIRHLLNNLCAMHGTHYLEIGCWKGSTFISSLFNNHKTISSAVAIDNWSEFWGPKAEFHQNCTNFLANNSYTFHESDCFLIDPKSVCKNPVNVYFYDGGHTETDQELAFTHYNEVFDEVFVAVVDDWNHPPVPLGTRKAFEKLGYKILFETILPARCHPDKELWWNGLYVAVIRK